MDTVVNYSILARALDYYIGIGYKRIEVPWAVSRAAIDITARGRHAASLRDGKSLVGSAEQSFLELELNPETALPPDSYCALTPCFRPGDLDGEYHQEYFMKIELFRTDVVDKYAVDEMIWDASVFMQQELRFQEYHIERIDTPEENYMIPLHDTGTLLSADLNLNGVEVGSYGLRHCPEFDWAYGTGLAEPRFSMAAAEYANYLNHNPITACA